MIDANEKQPQRDRLRTLMLMCALLDLFIRLCIVLSYVVQRFLPALFGPMLNSVSMMYYGRLGATITQIVPAVAMIVAWKRRKTRGMLVFVTSKSLYCIVMLGGLVGIGVWMFNPNHCIQAPACFATSAERFDECERKHCEWVKQSLVLLAISAVDWVLSVSFLGIALICYRLLGRSAV